MHIFLPNFLSVKSPTNICSKYFLNKEPHKHVFGSFLGHQPFRMHELLQFSSAEALLAGTRESKDNAVSEAVGHQTQWKIAPL